MIPACPNCNDTGSQSCMLDGYIDCPCEAGVERAGFNAWCVVNLPRVDLVDAWVIYQRGRESK